MNFEGYSDWWNHVDQFADISYLGTYYNNLVEELEGFESAAILKQELCLDSTLFYGFQNCVTAGRVKNHFGILLILRRLPILHSICKITTSNTTIQAFHIFLHFHTHLTFTNTHILIILTKQYLTLTHSTFQRSNIMGRLLIAHIRYTDFLKDSTGVFSSNLLCFFVLYSQSILHHLDIPSIRLLRNTLSQHSPLYSLTTLFNSIC